MALVRSRIVGSVFSSFAENTWLRSVSVAFAAHSHLQHSIACVKDGKPSEFENAHAQLVTSNYPLAHSYVPLRQAICPRNTKLVNADASLLPRISYGNHAKLVPRKQNGEPFSKTHCSGLIPRNKSAKLMPMQAKLNTNLKLMENQNRQLFLQTKENNVSLLNSLPQDVLVDRTELAIMTLNYNRMWLESFQPVYENALRMHSQIKPNPKNKLNNLNNNKSDITRHRNGVINLEEAMPPCMSQSKINQRSPRQLETVLFTKNLCKGFDKQTAKTSESPDKCDAMQLATVFLALREELPLFFQNAHGFNLYHKRIKFVNGLTGITTSGLTSYKGIMTAMRLGAQACLYDTGMEILKITENPKECNVMVRWRVSGVPRYRAILARQGPWNDKVRYVDGFSIFEVGKDGLIHCHRLQKLIPSKSLEAETNPLWALNPAAVIGLLRHKAPEMFARQRVEDVDVVFPAALYP